MIAKGVTGTVELDGNKITISRKGFSNFLLFGLKGEKTIYANSLSAIQFKKAGFLKGRGYIQFTLPGGNESRKGLFDAVKDENSVLFTRSQQRQFLALKSAVEAQMAAGSPAPAARSMSDEITRLAELRDRGALSEQEFQAAKQRLIA